jgi:hypothetical protein
MEPKANTGPSKSQPPSIGRSVHYFPASPAPGPTPKPQHAVIVDVIDIERDIVRLSVTNWYGTTATFDDVQRGDTPGCWSWPAFVPPR